MSKNKVHVGYTTVAYNHCIGCGVCSAVCQHNAISMIYTKYKEIQPEINNRCTECAVCVDYCPFTNDKIFHEAQKVFRSEDPTLFGLEESSCYIAYDKRSEKRIKSASGGVTTEIASHMLENGIIDVVIHADMAEGKIGEMHYIASVSRNTRDVESKRSSFYAPISFEKTLKLFEKKNEKILFIGLPCIIRAVNEVFSKNKHYKKNKLYTIALSCSHNVNGQFIDFLAESEGIKAEENFKVNLRNKDAIFNANQYKNHFFNKNKTIIKKDRFDTFFTKAWRNYFFAMNICNKCSDFWGYTADMSIKDAWGEWSNDPLGKSIVVIRNKEINRIFNENEWIEKEMKDTNVMAINQKATIVYKQLQINNKLYKKKYQWKNLKNGYIFKDFMLKNSKRWYSKYGYKKTHIRLNILIQFIKILEIFRKYKEKIIKIKENPYSRFILFNIKKIKNLFIYKKERKNYQILITGGYGYKNVGDEAQLNATMKLLKNEFPNYRQVILTHDRNYTYNEHDGCNVYESPREAFFDHNKIPLYGIPNLPVKLLFLLIGFLVYINAFLVRAELPTLLINAKKAALLEELKNSDMLFYCGGGYLTGKTLSRLWDGVFFIACAKVMDVPVVLSGQTIGVWNGTFNKWFAKWGLSKAKIITTRDPDESIFALREIGIENDKTFVTFDDALFCDKINMNETKKELIASGLHEKDFENYITLNVHYWGIEKDEDEKKRLRKRIYDMAKFILENDKVKIVLIAMAPYDYVTIDDFLKEYSLHNKIIKYDYNFDFRKIRGVIANSKLCITMKHHPIIFAIGEQVPVISLAYLDYYKHKNAGALKLFGLEKYNLDFDNNFNFNQFYKLYNIIFSEKNYIQNIRKKIKQLIFKRDKFLSQVKNIL